MPEAALEPTNVKDLARRLAGHEWVVGRLEDANRLIDRLELGGGDTLADMVPRDPRGVGVRGGYPQINQGEPNPKGLLEFARIAYRRSAPARVLVDRVAQDQWGEWFELVGGKEGFRKAVEMFMLNPTGRIGEKPLWWYFRQATRMARRDGRSLLHFGLVESGADSEKKPGRVQGVRYVQVIPEDRIEGKEVDKDPTSPTFGDVLYWRIRITAGEGQSISKKVHADRVIPFIPYPREDDPWEGDSVLVMNVNYVEAVENVLWSVVEAYFTEASPYIVVYKDGTGALTPEQKANVKEEITKMQQSSTQRIFVHGVRVEVLAGSGQLANPKPHWDVTIEAFAMASGMPMSILKGAALGEQAGAQEDSKRWAAIISKVQEEDGNPAINGLLSRLEAWGVESWMEATKQDSVQVRWHPIYEESPKLEADRQEVLMRTRAGYVDRGLPPPAEIDYEVTEDTDMLAAYEQAKPKVQASPFGGGVGAGEDTDEEDVEPRIEEDVGPTGVSPVVVRMRKRIERVLLGAYEQTARTAVGVQVPSTEARDAKRIARLLVEASSDPGIAFETQDFRLALSDAIEDGFLDAANEGNLVTLKDLDTADYYRVMTRHDVPIFSALSRHLADDVAKRLAADVRLTVAESLAAGMNPDKLRTTIMERYAASRVDAERIARTEAVRGYNAGAREALKSIGVANFVFEAFADADQECQERDGKSFSIASLEDQPPIHPNCRCALVADTDAGFGMRLEGSTTPGGVVYRAKRSRSKA